MNLRRTDTRSAGLAWLGVFCLLPSTPTSHNFNNHPTYTHPIHRLHLKSHLVTSPSVLMLEPIHHIILDLYHCDQPIVSRVRKASFWQTRDIRKCVSERRIVCPLHMVLYLDISTGITIGKPFLQPCSIPFPVRLQVFRNQFNSQIVNEVFFTSAIESIFTCYYLSSLFTSITRLPHNKNDSLRPLDLSQFRIRRTRSDIPLFSLELSTSADFRQRHSWLNLLLALNCSHLSTAVGFFCLSYDFHGRTFGTVHSLLAAMPP